MRAADAHGSVLHTQLLAAYAQSFEQLAWIVPTRSCGVGLRKAGVLGSPQTTRHTVL